MSAQFIHSNNQSMLWKVINNTPQTISYFANAPIGEKERWFQSIIGHVYNQYNGKNISLKDMNKRAIDFMLQSLVPSPTLQSGAMMASESLRSLPSESLRSLPSESLRSLPSESLHLSREQQMHEQFNRRQAEYESMVKKETPVAQFAEGVKDEAILDLDYAVKEYMKQRDQDIEIPPPVRHVASNDAPKVPSQSAQKLPSQSAQKLPSQSAQKLPLKLDLQNAEPISLIVEELPTKRVQWGENTEHVFDKNESIILDTASACLWQKDISEIKTKLDLIISLLRER